MTYKSLFVVVSLLASCGGFVPPGPECTTGAERACGPEEIGVCRKGTQTCVDGVWDKACKGAVLPGTEICNLLDDDCDAVSDEGVGNIWTVDVDGDGFGANSAGAETRTACTMPTGFSATANDCNDNAASISPGAQEACNSARVDDNCDGTIDEGCACTAGMMVACCAGRGAQTCTDLGAGPVLSSCSVSPVAETCNGVDDDCDGQVDEGACTSTDGGAGGGAGGGGAGGGAADGGGGAGGGAADGGGGAGGGATDGGGGAGGGSTDGGGGAGGGSTDGGGGAGGGSSDGGGGAGGGSTDGGAGGGGGLPDGGPVCVPGLEVCDGIDNDCDGQVDEALKISCNPDADNDLYATSGAVTLLCPNTGRPLAGNCPFGYVAPASSKGLDCSAIDPLKYRVETMRDDKDNDTSCKGPATQDCVGIASLPGRRVPSTCSPYEDCDDLNATLYATATVLPDSDGDGYCANQLVNRCVGNTAGAGFKFPAECLSQSDCNDNSAGVYRLANVRLDGDNDGYCIGPQTSQCIGAAAPSGWRLPNDCAGVDDCRDTNPLAQATCVLVDVYTTSSATKTCFGVPATESFTVSATNICPLGFVLGSYVAKKSVGNGFCSATSALTLSMTCNGLDGATCRIVGSCVAL